MAWQQGLRAHSRATGSHAGHSGLCKLRQGLTEAFSECETRGKRNSLRPLAV